jgi:hypothetical protein
MMIERDVCAVASEMIRLHGGDAAIHAGIRADALKRKGDEKGYPVWKRIVAAINELTSTEPSGSVN